VVDLVIVALIFLLVAMLTSGEDRVDTFVPLAVGGLVFLVARLFYRSRRSR
jgi:hypothetical protein